MSSIDQSKLRANLKLTINRLKLLQQKNTALAKQNRRSLVPLLENGKLESARIKIENIIQEDIQIELLESLEIYSELTMARSAMIHGSSILDARLDEALHVLIYSSQYVNVKELQILKPLLSRLASKEYVQSAIEDKESIPSKILSRIHVGIPSAELVDLYMLEIAKAYNVAVPGIYEPEPPKVEPNEQDSEKEGHKSNNSGDEKKDDVKDDIWARFAALKK